MTHSPETVRAALQASISHWEKNMQAMEPQKANTSRGGCALCGLFWEDDCKGCPVLTATGHTRCRAAPYAEADAALDYWYEMPTPENRAAFHDVARAMHEFLVTLLETK